MLIVAGLMIYIAIGGLVVPHVERKHQVRLSLPYIGALLLWPLAIYLVIQARQVLREQDEED